MWGKIIGGMAGFALGGPFGAIVGAAFGHAADQGVIGNIQSRFRPALPTHRDQLFGVAIVVIAAKLARADGPVKRAEIDAFKGAFRIPPDSLRDIGRLFDRARDSDEDPFAHATDLGHAFAANPDMRETILAALFAIARADAPLNRAEEQFLRTIWHRLDLDEDAWSRARDNRPRHALSDQDREDPYATLGVHRDLDDDTIRAAWRTLMRDHHPDILTSRGATPDLIARASDKVARINAAWDRIKRERGL